MQKYWKDKKKEKFDHRRKRFKPPFNRNESNINHQDQYSKGESKKEDSLGKRGRPPIQCWGCKEDYMYNDFPHRKDIVKTFHNVQEPTTVEDMGRIYAALDDQKEEYLGKRGRPPIQCWGCKEDRMYKDVSHKKYKVKTMHNFQEATIVEDMGRIYVALDDRQE